MRHLVASALGFALVAAPVAAEADPWGCLVGPTDLSSCVVGGTPAAILGAIAAPVILAGAAVTVASELRRHTDERLADGNAASATAPKGKHAPSSLALVPTPLDPYRAQPGHPETRAKPSAAFQFNETATNVAIAATGAMVVGAIIADIVHDSTQHHK